MIHYLLVGALFYILSPGNFFTLPRGGSKRIVALVHDSVFDVAYYLSQKVAEILSLKMPTTELDTIGTVYLDPKKKRPTLLEISIDRWNTLNAECEAVKAVKEDEYITNGDNTSRFRELNKEQTYYCDQANELMTNLEEIGYKHIPDEDDIVSAREKLNENTDDCRQFREERDEEYSINGDNTERFRELDRMQAVACEKANDAADKLKALGVSTSSFW